MIRPSWFNLTLRSVVPLLWALAAATTNAQPQPCEGWVPIPGHPNPYHAGTVYAATAFDPDGAGPHPEQLIVGGEALRMQGTTGGNVYRWDGHRWHEMGQGFDRSVLSLAVYEGRLYAGGDFSNSGGTPMPALARWAGPGMGDHWEPVEAPGGSVFTRAPGGNPTVRAMTLHQGRLIVVGGFSQVGNLPTGNIASWDGMAFSTFGTGLGDYVRAVTVHQSELVVGGDFTTAGGLPASRLARWNGTAWLTVGPSASDQGVDRPVRALASHNNQLVIGGEFILAGTRTSSYRIVALNQQGWRSFGTATNGSVRGLQSTRFGLVAAGNFTRIGGVASRYLSYWDGATWSNRLGDIAPTSQPPTPTAVTIAPWNDGFLVGGQFSLIGDIGARSVAAYRPEGWRPFASGLAGGMISQVVTFNGVVYAAGTFLNDGDQVLRNGLARWDGRKWTTVPGWNSLTQPSSILVANGRLWVSGSLSPADFPGTTVRAACFDGTTWTWAFGGPGPEESMGGGSFYNDRLVLSSLRAVYSWDGHNWASPISFPEGIYGHTFLLNDEMHALLGRGFEGVDFYRYTNGSWMRIGPTDMIGGATTIQRGGLLYASGSFDRASLSIWDGNEWTYIGPLFQGGVFTQVGEVIYTTARARDTGYQTFILGNRRVDRFSCPGDPAGDFFGMLLASAGPFSGPGSITDGTQLFVSGPPTIIGQPIALSPCPHEPLRLDIAAVGIGMTYQWRRDSVPIPGATESVYEDPVAGLPAAGVYDCVLTNACGEVISGPVRYAPCLADHDCSGFIDFFDYADFVTDFEAGSPRADTNRDGFVDVFDYDTFVESFETGC